MQFYHIKYFFQINTLNEKPHTVELFTPYNVFLYIVTVYECLIIK